MGEGEGAGEASYDVEALVALRHDRKGRPEFLVRWKTYDAAHDTWEPLENLEGTADQAIQEYYATHPQTRGFDCLEGESRNEHDLSNQFSSAVTSFYQFPSLEAYVAVAASRPSTLPQRQLYDDAIRWLRDAAVVAVAEADRKFQRDSSSPEVRIADLKYFRVMIDLCIAEEVHGSSGVDSKGLILLLQKILPLRPHCLLWSARSHAFELSALLERIAEVLMPSEPGMAASIARSQLLSHAGHIGRQARQAWATGPETVARVAASAIIDEQGERFLASLHSLAAEDEFIGTMSTKKPKQRRKRPGSAAGPVAKKGVKRPLEPTLSEGTTVGSTSSQGSAESGTQAQMSAADGDGGDAPLQTVAAAAAAEEGAEDGELGGVNKKQRVEASGAGPNEGARRSDTDAVAMDTVTAAPVKLEQAQVSATTGADATDVITAAHSNGSSGNVKSSGDGDNANGGPEGEAADDEAQDDEEESSSEEELVPRATRSRSTLSDVALGDTAEYESGGENDVEDERKARNNEKEFVGQRELEYTWRPLGTPLDAPGFGSTVLRCSTHSAAAEVLLAITDVLMLVTRKDRVFANKKLPGLKSWLETHGVPMWYYGFRPRGWTGNEERSDSQEYRGNMTPCLAYENVRFVLRWLCGSKARTGDLVASWKAAGGRQWLQAEIEHSNGFSAPGNGGRGAGDTAVAALRARNHRQTEQERFTKETSQKERLVQALPRWYQLLCRATECAAATAAASASGEMTSGSVNVTAAECENPPDWPAARRPLWLRELHGRTVAQVIGVEEVLSELTRALRRAGGFPLYRSPRPGHPPPTELPADTSLAATAKESEIAELPAADQSLEAAAGSTTGSDQQSDAEMAAVAKLREWLHRT